MKNFHLNEAIAKAMAQQYPQKEMTPQAKIYHRANGQSDGEEGLWWQITKLSKVPKPEREVRLIEGRKWRCDFVWREPKKLVVEIEGGIWTGGRHVRPRGFIEDIKKYKAIQALGFPVHRVTPDMVKSGEVLAFLEEFFGT